MPPLEAQTITIAGAGSVGCYVGGLLAAAGRRVTLLARPALADRIAHYGLAVSDLDGGSRQLAPKDLKVETDAASALEDASIVLVTVKSQDTEQMAALIAKHAPHDALAVSLQNGVSNAEILCRQLPADRVVDAMVPFNVIQSRPEHAAPHVHRASGGGILIEKHSDRLRDTLSVPAVLSVPDLPITEHGDIDAVLWGKLLVNLNNGLNALSGLPLVEQFGDRRWRLLVARQLSEALSIVHAAGIRYAPYEGVPQRVLSLAMRLPDGLFRLAARGIFSMDRSARSSMWEDLQAGRRTEIDYLQGEILRLADRLGMPAPLNRRVLELVKEAEEKSAGSPELAPQRVESGR